MDKDILCDFAFICDNAFFSQGNKLNIIGIFKEIVPISPFPFQHPQIFIVTNLQIKNLGPHEAIIKIVRLRDSIQILQDLKFNITVTEDKKVRDFIGIAQLANVKFEEAGNYEIQILVDGTLIKTLPLNIKSA